MNLEKYKLEKNILSILENYLFLLRSRERLDNEVLKVVDLIEVSIAIKSGPIVN